MIENGFLGMVGKYVLFAIIGGVFIAGIGIGFTALHTTTIPGPGPMNLDSMSPQHLQQAMQDPEFRQNMVNEFRNNPQHMNQMMGVMMKDSQMRQQMMGVMQQHPEMMSDMQQHKSMRDHMMGSMSGMMGGQGMKGNNMIMDRDMDKNSQPIMKQQTRNQIGIMLQDPELKQQMRDLVLQKINTSDTIGSEVLATGQSLDGTVSVEVKSSTPMPGKFLEIIETFHDKDMNILEHVNHSIHVTQDDQTVLKMSDLHSHHGEITYYTRELHSDSPVEIEILMNGIGMEEPLTGPVNEIISVKIS